VHVRTFSPVEELAMCLQTSLATPLALGAGHGETWKVGHPAGVLTITVEGSGASSVCWAHDPQSTPGRAEPVDDDDLPEWARPAGGRQAVRLAQARSRLYLELPDVDGVNGIDGFAPPSPKAVTEVCRAHGCTGIVYYAPLTDTSVRTRVFTTSLGGREDSATGGAAQGVGTLLSRAGHTGRVEVTQGPPDPYAQSRLLLDLDGREGDVRVGGRVRPLLTGRTAAL
jgi:predicted PhzF superfamily epimerase YddE/YHI9